jgi:hypothetical protein
MAVWLKIQVFCDATLCVSERKVSQSFGDFCAFKFRINSTIKKTRLTLKTKSIHSFYMSTAIPSKTQRVISENLSRQKFSSSVRTENKRPFIVSLLAGEKF